MVNFTLHCLCSASVKQIRRSSEIRMLRKFCLSVLSFVLVQIMVTGFVTGASFLASIGERQLEKREPLFNRSGVPCYHFHEFCRENDTASAHDSPVLGKKVLPVRPHALSRSGFLYARCFCDSDCGVYGECCYDVARKEVRAIKEHFKKNPTEDMSTAEIMRWQRRQNWECHTVTMSVNGTILVNIDLYMIASCPSFWPDKYVSRQCHRSVSRSRYDYTLDLPVISVATNLTYANIFCAICNDDVTDMLRWTLHIHCPPSHANCTDELAHWNYVPGQLKWQSRRRDRELNTTVVTYITLDLPTETLNAFYERYGARKCRTDVVQSCPAEWQGAKERILCSAYALYVRSITNDVLYRNKYCAMCHRQSTFPKNLTCPPVRPLSGATNSMPGKAERKWIKSKNYAVLLDFVGDGGKVGETFRCGTRRMLCTRGEICDPVRDGCIPYTCGRMFEMGEDGLCVRSVNPDEKAGGGRKGHAAWPTLTQDCPKVYVAPHRYVRFSNKSIYVNRTDRFYSVSDYEVVNKTHVLICVSPNALHIRKFSYMQSVVSHFCVSLSLVCLVVHIAVHAVVPQLRNLPGKNLLCLSLALFVAQVCFEFAIDTSAAVVCVSVAVAIHFGFLASFFWMNVMAFDICRTFCSNTHRLGNKRAACRLFVKYSLYSWGLPLVIVGSALMIDSLHFLPALKPMYGQSLCWINSRRALLVFFAIPLAILLLMNLVSFILTVVCIYRTSETSKMAQNSTAAGRSCGLSSDRTRMVLYAKLALIMGLTWIFGFVAALTDVQFIWYLFIVFNCLQGTFIFLSFSCKRKVFNLVKERFFRSERLSGTSDEAGNKNARSTTSSSKQVWLPQGTQSSTASTSNTSPKGNCTNLVQETKLL